MVYIVIQVSQRLNTVKPWYGFNVPEIANLADIFSGLADDLEIDIHAVTFKVFAGSSKKSCDVEISVDCNICDVVSAHGCFLNYCLFEKTAEVLPAAAVPQEKRNAFSVLMSASKLIIVPETCQVINEKARLKNDIILWLQKNNLGWERDCVDTLGKQFVSILTNCLWTVDGHNKTLADRGHGVPNLFNHFQGYNHPELRKQKKREHSNLDRGSLLAASDSLYTLAGATYMKTDRWNLVYENTLKFANALRDHAEYLQSTCKKMKEHHEKTESNEKESWKLFNGRKDILPTNQARYKTLHDTLVRTKQGECIFVNDYAPNDRRRRHEYITNMVSPIKSVLYTYSTGGEQLVFMWQVPSGIGESDVLNFNATMKNRLKEQLPTYHTRAMRREFINYFGTVTHSHPAFLREAYRRLTGDKSVCDNATSKEVDERVKQIMENEDADLVMDLRVNNQGQPEQYTEFLQLCQTHINQNVETAVDDRRHDHVVNEEVITHLATALSARDLYDEVVKRCPDGTAIPSLQWLRIQFWPRRPSTRAAGKYSGAIKIKYMVQARQFRMNHVDCHYASAIYRYQREFAVKYRQYVTYASMDDKHTLKVGEPGYPVSAVERGKAVLVQGGKKLVVGDHDFTKFSLTPSVALLINIPQSIEESFHRGKVFVGLKENAFQASSPIRHMTELYKMLESQGEDKPIQLLYTDGGPDHRLTYISVMISLVALFKRRNYYFLCAVRTPPYNSWKNPVERIMSILNLGHQGIGLMRDITSYEEKLKDCSSLSDIRKASQELPEIIPEVLQCMEPVKNLIASVICRLKLKGQGFKIFEEATNEEMEEMWNFIKQVDDTLTKDHKTKQSVKNHTKWNDFLQTHCKVRHYMFCILKCNNAECCGPPRLPIDVFQSLHHLPDPVPIGDRYQDFSTVYGEETAEQHRPSLKQASTKSGDKGMPFNPTAQYARNTNTVIKCEECKHWRCIYAKKKITKIQENELKAMLDTLDYTCGSSFQHIDCDEASIMQSVYVNAGLTCNSPTELPYYSARYDDVCCHCGEEKGLSAENAENKTLPRCRDCISKISIKRRGHKFVKATHK